MRSAAAKRIKTLRNDSLLRAAFEEDDDADETANRRLIFYTSVNVTRASLGYEDRCCGSWLCSKHEPPAVHLVVPD